MLSNKIILCLLTLSFVFAYPITERGAARDNGLVLSRATKASGNKAPAKAPAKIEQYTGGGVVENARKANNAPGRTVPKTCKKVTDCSCPNNPNSKTGHSTSCINGVCKCDDATVNFFANKFMDAIKAIGNAGITKAIGHLMQGLADVKQVASIIAGAVLGPQAKLALKGALLAFPDTGPSHIDQATKGILTKGL